MTAKNPTIIRTDDYEEAIRILRYVVSRTKDYDAGGAEADLYRDRMRTAADDAEVLLARIDGRKPTTCGPHGEEYITADRVTRLRLINEEGIGSGGPWGIDGADDAGNYTEACETYPTREDAVAAIPAFRVRLGLAESVPVVESRA